MNPSEQIHALIETLLETERQLEELTAGEVDTVAGRDGRTFLLRRAQEQFRYNQAAKQAALLNELRVLFDLIPAMVWFKDTENRILRVNKQVAENVGKSVEEIEGKPSHEIYPNEAAKYYMDDLEVIRSGVPKLGISETLRNRVGEEIWVQTDKVPVCDKEGKVIGIIVMAQDITERKQVQEDLRRQQAELQALFDLMPAMVWFKDTENRILRVNKRVAENDGKPIGEIEGKSMFETYPKEAAKYYADDLEVIRSGAPKLEIVETLRNRKSEEIWIQTDKVPVCDKEGKVTGIIVMAQDITERKRAATALLKSKQFLQSTLDALSAHIVILDEHGTIIEVNAAWNRFARENNFLGSSLGVGDNYMKVCNSVSGSFAEEASEVAKGIRAIMAGQSEEFHLEYPCHSPKERRWFIVHVTRFGEEDAVRVVVAHENITERKQAEAVRDRIAAILESTTDLVSSSNPAGQLIYLNRAGRTLLGIGLEEDITKIAIADFLPNPSSHPILSEGIPTAIREGNWSGESILISRHGHKFPISQVILAHKNLEGKLEFLSTIARDITESKRIEAQLVQAQKLESVGQLAAGIAHEINTPIQFVGDNIHFLKDSFGELSQVIQIIKDLLKLDPNGALNPMETDSLRNAIEKSDLDYLMTEIPVAMVQSLEGINRVAKIVQAMKEFSHPGTEEKKLTNLNKAIESTITVARNEWKYLAEMVIELDPNLPSVPCLVGDFNQVILNLIVNAAHAIADTPAVKNGGKGNITISTHFIAPWVEIRIQDTGTGIPESARSKIFDPFFTTKGVGKGTGQGLFISHNVIVKKHGGEISFETKMGEGTTFILRLPLHTAHADPEASA